MPAYIQINASIYLPIMSSVANHIRILVKARWQKRGDIS